MREVMAREVVNAAVEEREAEKDRVQAQTAKHFRLRPIPESVGVV